MTNRNLMKPKAAITRRRLIITFILMTILAVSVMTGYSSGLDSDGTAYTPEAGMNMIMREKPEDGTPSDHDLLSAVKYTAYNIYKAPYFRGETVGDVVADLGIIKYTQHVHNMRVVKGDKIFSEAISSSSLKSVAEQKFFKGTNTVLYRASTSINGDSAVFADSAGRMPIEDFYKAYGVIPNEITKHYIHEDSILSVRDENAGQGLSSVKSAANADNAPNADGGSATEISFAVPERLVPDADGNYRFTLELKPFESTKYYRNEVRTLAGADLNPVFRSVNVTFYIDARFYPISVTSTEVYDIAIPVIGAMTCTSTLTETFTDIGAEGDAAVLPEDDFFSAFIDSADVVDPGATTRSPADYLAAAFAPYLDGSSDLELAADIQIDGIPKLGALKLDDVRLAVNVGTMNIKAALGALNVQYSDDKVYLTLGDVKGYIPTSAFEKLSGNATLNGLMSGLPDFSNLFGDDILATVFANCQMTTENGVTTIRLPFTLTDGISVDASLRINDDDMSLRSITGTVKALGMTVEVSARPESSTFPEVDGSYKDFSAALDYVNDILDFAAGNTYGIAGTVKIQDVTATVNAYIERGDSLTAEADINVFGQDVKVVYAADALYATVGNIKLQADSKDIPELMTVLGDLIGMDGDGVMGAVKLLMPRSLDDVLRMIKSIDVSDSALSVRLSLLGLDLDAAIERGATWLGAKLGINGAIFGKPINASADLALSVPQKQVVAVPEDCVALGDVMPLIKSLKKYITANGLTVELDATVDLDGNKTPDAETVDPDNNTTPDPDADKIKISATLAVEYASRAVKATVKALGATVDLAYIGDTAYVSVGNINVKCKIAEVKELLTALDDVLPFDAEKLFDKLDPVLGAVKNGAIDVADIADKAISSIKSITVADGVIRAELGFGNIGLTVDLPVGIDGASVSLAVNDADVGVTLNTVTPGCAHITAPTADFVPLSKFTPVVNAVTPLIGKTAYTLELSGNVFGVTLTGNANIVLPQAATETEPAKPLALSATLGLGDISDISVKLIGDRLYIDIPDTLHVALGTDQASINKLMTCINGLLPTKTTADDAPKKDAISALVAVVKALTALDPIDVLGAVTLANTTDGLAISADLTALKVDASATLGITLTDGAVTGAKLDASAAGMSASIGLTATDGVFDGAKIAISGCTVNAELTGFAATEITATGTYMSVDTLLEYVEPIYAYVNDILASNALGLKLNATVTDKNGKYMKIACDDLTVGFADKDFAATVTLFAETDAAQDVELCYTKGKLYIKAGTIALSLDLGAKGENSDKQRLYNILSRYLPGYLKTELGKLLGLTEGKSSLGNLSPVIKQIKAAAKAESVGDAVSALFEKIGGENGKSSVKTLLDMVELCETDGSAVIHVKAFGQTLRVEPILRTSDDGKTALEKLNARLDLGNTEIDIDVAPSAPKTIQAPDGDFVSLVEFLEVVSDAVGTFTAVDPAHQNEITFEIPTFSFTFDKYAVNNADGTVKTDADKITVSPVSDGYEVDADGNEMLDADGNKIEKYKKALVGKITKHSVLYYGGKLVVDGNGAPIVDTGKPVVGNGKPVVYENTDKPVYDNDESEVVDADGNPILKGENETLLYKDCERKTEYSFALEAHIALDVASMSDTSGTILLDVYLIDNYPAPSTAYIKYTESKTKLSELMSIDSKSLMQILAAVFDIIDVDDDTMNKLFGANRLSIDTSLFSSMKIAGLDGIKSTINGLASGIEKFGDTFDELKDIWSLIENAGSMEKFNDKEFVDGIVSKLMSVISPAPSDPDKEVDGEAKPIGGAMDGSLFKRIVNGVSFAVGTNTLTANVKNEITTGGKGDATVTVTHSDGKLNAISIGNLDVNTGSINADVSFVAGCKVEFSAAPDPTKPGDNTTYTDLSNIKRLLFDVMNTANLKEFQIGGFDTDDSISVSIPIGSLKLVEVPIKYNVEVKLVDQGENAQPRYKTAAVVELKFEDCKAASATVVPDCTTRLYFYDDVLYVEGYRFYKDQWLEWEKVKVGGSWLHPEYEWQWVEHTAKDYTFEPVSVKYTVKELAAMFKNNDMNTFLYNFLFYLLPLSTDFTFVGTNLQETIYDAATATDSSSSNSSGVPAKTFANIFNSYTYSEESGKHEISISLKTLIGNKQFDDLNISLTGANDGDDETFGITNNYIAAASVSTKMSIVSLSLNATLKAPTQYSEYVDVCKLDENGKHILVDGEHVEKEVKRMIKSSGIGDITLDKAYKLYGFDKATANKLYGDDEAALLKHYNADGDDIVYDYLFKNQDKFYNYDVVKNWVKFEDIHDKENKL